MGPFIIVIVVILDWYTSFTFSVSFIYFNFDKTNVTLYNEYNFHIMKMNSIDSRIANYDFLICSVNMA